MLTNLTYKSKSLIHTITQIVLSFKSDRQFSLDTNDSYWLIDNLRPIVDCLKKHKMVFMVSLSANYQLPSQQQFEQQLQSHHFWPWHPAYAV